MEFHGEGPVGQIQVGVEKVGDSAVFRPRMSEFRKQAEIAIVPKVLSMAVAEWVRDNPGCRVRSTHRILQDGHTVAIQVGFDRPSPTAGRLPRAVLFVVVRRMKRARSLT